MSVINIYCTERVLGELFISWYVENQAKMKKWKPIRQLVSEWWVEDNTITTVNK